MGTDNVTRPAVAAAAPLIFLQGDDLIREIPATTLGVILEEDDDAIRVRYNDRFSYATEDWWPHDAWTRRDWTSSTRRRVGQR